MRSNLSTLKKMAASAALIASLVACVKQRPDVVPQGENLDELYSMGDRSSWQTNADNGYILESTKYTIRTGEVVKKSENTAAETAKIEDGTTFIKHLNIVDYTSDDPLLRGTADVAEMFGESRKAYPVIREITPDFLILNKVVSENEISTFEKTYSRRQGANWIVPVGGYPMIGFYNIEKALNEENRSTNVTRKIPIPSQDFKSANYYDIDESSFTKFGRIQKTDLLPKSFFLEGEWYFSETIVKIRYDRDGDVGDVGSADSNLSPASRVKFEVKDNSLIGLNTNVDDDFKDEENKQNYNTVIKIPVTLLDYKREKTGNQILAEKEDNEKKAQERSFLKLDFSNSETPSSAVSAEGGGGNENDILDKILNKVNQFKTLLDVTYADNFMSFAIHDARTGVIKRYAMKKITLKPGDPGNLKPRRLFKEDNQIFGVFSTMKAKKVDYKVHLRDDIEKLLIMARHNPDKDIVYYFSDQTPKDEWYRNIGREAVNIWQQAFVKAGLKNTVRLNESFDVALGDIRYNVINIVRDGIGGSLGFGPSLVDTESGEMVSSTTNLGMEPILGRHYGAVRNYLARKSGNFYNLKMHDADTALPLVLRLTDAINSGKLSLQENGTWTIDGFEGLDQTGTALDPAKFNSDEKALLAVYGISTYSTVKDLVLKMRDKVNLLSAVGQNSRFLSFRFYSLENSFSSTEKTDAFIEKNCKSVVSLAEKMKKSLVLTDEEIPIIDPCVQILAQSEAVWATIHEMGHNFSLAHNFRGSTDTANYPALNSYAFKFTSYPSDLAKQKTSSAMDYLSTEGRQLLPGGYDIAALRWIYRGQVQDKSGNWINVDTTKPIEATVKKSALKSYLFCSDYNRIYSTDPLCDAFDQGTTPLEVTKYTIDSVFNDLAGVYRYNTTGTGRLTGYLQGNIMTLKEHYDAWRNFLKNETSLNRKYLQNMSIEEYQSILDNVADQDALKEHLKVRNMIVRFLLNVAFMNNKYCVVTKANDATETYVELERIRLELRGLGETRKVNTCQSDAVVEYMAKKQMTYVREIGHFLDSGTYSLDPNTSDVTDFSGTIGLRVSAFAGLTSRNSASLINIIDNFAPNFVDEPDIRELVSQILLDRVNNGVRVDAVLTQPTAELKSDLFSQDDLVEWTRGTVVKKFDSEKTLISNFVAIFINGLGVPNDGQETINRTTPYFVSTIQNPELVKGQYTNIFNYGSGFLWVRSNDGFAGQIMNRIDELNQQKQMAKIDPAQVKQLKNTVLLAISKFLPDGKNPMTVADILKIQAGVGQLLATKDKVKDAGFIATVALMLSPEMVIVRQIDQQTQAQYQVDLQTLQQLANDPNGDPKQKEEVAKILAQITSTPAAELYKKIDPELQAPTIANLSVRLDKIIAAQTPLYEDYIRNTEEYASQSKMLLDVLLLMAN